MENMAEVKGEVRLSVLVWVDLGRRRVEEWRKWWLGCSGSAVAGGLGAVALLWLEAWLWRCESLKDWGEREIRD
ncbi:uncharacterized protein G2W53_041170 [Senna tora]|uniref:Uncharacterized protein n=1 Tax=Senna tora TaxID=362788 RepID=A0A834SER8_9FABA|nr:uncharacterized protein G2W53_041170 [Senna tora]